MDNEPAKANKSAKRSIRQWLDWYATSKQLPSVQLLAAKSGWSKAAASINRTEWMSAHPECADFEEVG